MILQPVLLLCLFASSDLDPRAFEVFERTYAAWHEIQSMSYDLHKMERMRDGSIVREEIEVKLQRPMSFYVNLTILRKLLTKL